MIGLGLQLGQFICGRHDQVDPLLQFPAKVRDIDLVRHAIGVADMFDVTQWAFYWAIYRAAFGASYLAEK
jgi:hypothetical protein